MNFNNRSLELFSMGKKRMISALLWVTTMLESDHDHYKNSDYNSWIFLRLKTITRLDPLFQEAYLYGGQYLSVIKDDDLGAQYIFDRGMDLVPENFYIKFYAGFHYYLELKDFKRAISIFESIQDHPQMQQTMPNIKTFIARLYEKGGDYQTALMLLEQILRQPNLSPAIKQRLSKRVKQIHNKNPSL
ncbi:MAG: hypothetical protein HN353_03255 [Bdellovibrionales bacterium]|nr:hypothetical protein [Bdellovibrionales bacterium]MBT3526099.1 hypothetical protein [Bdellovibrionales bacterium]MBT7669898.1 hypothetical protein [Bdellovibrionales bacterium]MBT7766952.1 hypothetical protein [Bdellovibrionales bacterium]